MSLNRVELSGRITRDVELRRVGAAHAPLASFSLAVNRMGKGDQPDSTSFFDCKAWHEVGEHIAANCRKGDAVVVRGCLNQDTWEDKTDGKKRSRVVVVVFEYEPDGPPRREARPSKAAPASTAPDDEEDIPF